MKLPAKFEEILRRDQALHGSVHLTLSTFETWLRQNKLPFFPEYTDHSEDHVEQVLLAAQALIKEEAWELISPDDVAVIALAVLVHDSGMHISEDSFIRLIDANNSWPSIREFEDIPWSQLWVDFLGEASRFDTRKLNLLFGEDKPVRKPPLDPQEMTRRDRMLIGEFLRRHHARLAHEIALNGVPSVGTVKFEFHNVPKHIARLAGMVARSHGVSLRSAVEWLPSEQRRETKGAHVPFLMALLRIADYLQVQQERAPKDVLSITALRSPLSQREWKTHGAVKDINNTHDDIEAIYVVAEPEEVRTYLNLVELFKSVQRELDASWSVLGEVYAIHPKLKNLGLSGLAIRRLRSNLDKVEEFSSTVPYVAERVSLRTANAELTNLLIEPLYGNKPEIGVRELLQNAVDACRELEDYCKQNPHIKPDVTGQKAQVKVELSVDSSGNKWLEITDQGIGMTVETVKNHFLTVGASFRASDVWKKQHTSIEGESRVLRSGRFGIGALAAFLIGNKVSVTTRHVSQPVNKAVTFSFGVSDDAIELRYKTAKVGTSIRIAIEDEERWKRLISQRNESEGSYGGARDIWEWFFLKEPKVSVTVSGKELSNATVYPSINEELPPEWHNVVHPDFEAIHWFNSTNYNWRDRNLVCNGIFVTSEIARRHYGHSPFSDASTLYMVYPPKVSVFDKEGALPLNLQRTEVHNLPFEGAIRQDIIRDTLAYLLVFGPTNVEQDVPARYPPVYERDDFSSVPWLLYSEDGFVLADCWLMVSLGYERVISSTTSAMRSQIRRNRPFNTLFAHPRVHQSSYKAWLDDSLRLPNIFTHRDEETTRFFSSARVAISLPKYKDFQTFGRYRKELRDQFKDLADVNGWVLLDVNFPPEEALDFTGTISEPPDESDDALAEFYFNNKEWETKEASEVGQLWLDTIGDTVIPFDMGERQSLLAHSFKELDEYIQKHSEAVEKKKS